MGYALGCLIFRYATFSGRARRLEYWMFCLLYVILAFAAGFADGALRYGHTPTDIGPFYAAFSLLTFIPLIAVTVRRLHDTGRSGSWYFFGFIPVIGWIWLFVLMVLPGMKGENYFGADPIAHKQTRQDVLNALGRTG